MAHDNTTQAARIMACKSRNPGMNSVQIALLVGATPHYVRVVMNRMGQREEPAARKVRIAMPKRFIPTVFGSCSPRRSTYTQLI